MPTLYCDAELIAACNGGEAWAWDALVDRYKGLVYSVALRAGLAEEDAADVFRTVFARLLEHLERINQPQGLAAWFITTTRREAWRALQKRRREGPSDQVASMLDLQSPRDADMRPFEALLLDRDLVREALALLEGRCRELLTLLYFEPAEPSYEQIGDRLRMPVGSIGPTRARCLQKMRDILRRMGMSEA